MRSFLRPAGRPSWRPRIRRAGHMPPERPQQGDAVPGRRHQGPPAPSRRNFAAWRPEPLQRPLAPGRSRPQSMRRRPAPDDRPASPFARDSPRMLLPRRLFRTPPPSREIPLACFYRGGFSEPPLASREIPLACLRRGCFSARPPHSHGISLSCSYRGCSSERAPSSSGIPRSRAGLSVLPVAPSQPRPGRTRDRPGTRFPSRRLTRWEPMSALLLAALSGLARRAGVQHPEILLQRPEFPSRGVPFLLSFSTKFPALAPFRRARTPGKQDLKTYFFLVIRSKIKACISRALPSFQEVYPPDGPRIYAPFFSFSYT